MAEIDLLPLIENLYIVDKDGLNVRLGDVMHPAQKRLIRHFNYCLNNNLPIRIIVLKARQIGVSTIIEGLLFLFAMLRENMKGLVISHELDSSAHLLSMTQNYFDNFEFDDSYTQKNKSAKTLSWIETNSDIRITTAGNKDAGRSRTIHFLHASEVAFWLNAKTLMTGLLQVVPRRAKTVVALESTANGIGNYFHDTWTKSCNGLNNYVPFFFPWWSHPEYRGSVLDLKPIYGQLDEHERALVQLLLHPPKAKWNDFESEPYEMAEIMDRLAWRRDCIANECQGDLLKFQQEYPSTPDEAFVSTGKNIFPLDSVTDCFKPLDGYPGSIQRDGKLSESNPHGIRFQPDPIEGKLTIFKGPGRGEQYVLAGDPTRTMEGDYAVAQVLNRRTWEQVAIYRAKVDGRTFGEKCGEIGMYYNEALIAVEQLGGGEAAIAILQATDYPNIWQHEKADKMPGQIDNFYGWQTNNKTKHEAISNLRKVLVDRDIIFHDQTTHDQLKNFVNLGGGKFGNSNEEEHDDNVMAMAIAVTVVLYAAAELIMQTPDRQQYNPKPGRMPESIIPHTAEQLMDYNGPEELPGWMEWEHAAEV